MSNLRFEKLGFYRPICFYGDKLLCYKKNKLFFYDGKTFVFHCKIKISGFRGFISKTRFLTRLSHRYVYCGIVPKGKSFAYISANDGIYKVSLIEKNNIIRIFSFKPNDMHRPLSFFEIKSIDCFADSIVFGDYSYNKAREEMSIYSISLTSNDVKPVFAFPKKSIRHIHSLIPDPYRKRILILTGDKDNESGIWEAKDDFKDVKPIFIGLQQYRFCAGKSFKDYVVLVTDSPFDQNYIYSLKQDGEEHHLDIISELPGPSVFFTLSHENELIFATDVENDEKNLTPIQEFFINKKGDGVLDDYSHIFSYHMDSGLREIAKFKKDFWPMRIFGFGTVHFPTGGTNSTYIYFYPMAVKKYDQQLIRINRDEKN